LTLWKIITKYQIRLKTSRFRKNRRLFFIIVYTISLFWALYLGPIFIDAIIPDYVQQISSQFEILIINIVEYTFTSFFLMSVMYPLFVLFRKATIPKKDIILSTPVKSGDLILGEFLGQLPFYTLFILAIGPFGISLILQVNPELNMFHNIIFYASFLGLAFFGTSIGNILSNWLELKIETNKKLKRYGNITLILVSISVLSIFYLFHFAFEFLKTFPEYKNYFLFYPSFWFSNIVLYFIEPSLIESSVITIWGNLGCAVLIPILFNYIVYKKAYLFHEMKIQTENGTGLLKKKSFFYQFISKITLKKYQTFVVIQFKSFLRKKENIMKLIYIIGTISLLSIFMIITFENRSYSFNISPFNLPITFQIVFNKNVIGLIISWMGGLIFGVLMGMYDFMGSKELIDVYKKTPRGIKVLIFSFIYQVLMIIVIFDIIFTIFLSFLIDLEIFISLLCFFIYLINSLIIFLQAIGIQSIRPLFEERRKNLIFNNYLILFLQILSLLITLVIYIPIFPDVIDSLVGLTYILLYNVLISITITIFICFFGFQKLKTIE